MMRYAKAIVGSLLAGLGALLTALADGSVQTAEWVTVAIAALTALAGVWGVPNRAEPEHALRSDRLR